MFSKKEYFGQKIVNVTENGWPLSVHIGPSVSGRTIYVTDTQKLPVYSIFQDITHSRTNLRKAIMAFKNDEIQEDEVEAMILKYETANRRAGQALKTILGNIITVARDDYGLPMAEIDVLLLQLLEENGGGTPQSSNKAILEKISRERLSEFALVTSAENE